MDRIQKKCLLGSMCGHALLLGILLIGAAFTRQKQQQAPPICEIFIPGGKMTMGASSGGEPPPPAPQPQQQEAQPAPQPVVAQPPPTPVPVQPQPRAVDPEPVKPILSQNPKAEISIKAPTKTHVVKVNLKPTTFNNREKERKQAQEAAEQAARAEAIAHGKRIASSIRSLGSGVSSRIVSGTGKASNFEVGVGGGGPAFSNYDSAIYDAYYSAWHPPDDLTDDLATAEVRIVVSRNGSIVIADLIRRSGKSGLDSSVQAALRAVRQLPAFPEECKDAERSYKIRFNLKSKQSFG